MRIKNQAELLDAGTRKLIIDEIMGGENQARKDEAYRRYIAYKDMTSQLVIDQLKKQLDADTVTEMQYCISNISIVRKAINKLARVYDFGVKREIKSLKDNKALQLLSDQLKVNESFKGINRVVKLQRNGVLYIKPCPYNDGENVKYGLKVDPLHPHLYDAVEHYYDRTKPMAFILSDYEQKKIGYTVNDPATANRNGTANNIKAFQGDGKDQKIADSPLDAETRTFIWWTDSFHFTTNARGEIISGSEIENPIGELPFVNYAIDQDGQFWALGGNDLIDGAVLINSVLTHNQHIAITQGYGQFFMKGKNVPRNIKIGPTKAIILEYDEGEPVPDLGFVNANPALDSMRSLVEQYVALLLTTNNLSVSSVASSLQGGMSAPSGIAMVLDKAESMEDVNEQRGLFSSREVDVFRKAIKWIDVLNDSIIDELKGIRLSESSLETMSLKFGDAPVIMSESEKLDALAKRKELGLDRMIDLIMKDNPDFTQEQAEERLRLLLEEKMKATMVEVDQDSEGDLEDDQSEKDNSDDERNQLDA